MKKLIGGAAAAAGVLAAAEAAGCFFFYRKVMKRNRKKTERTMKMSGVDWQEYESDIEERGKWLADQPQEDVWITSDDDLKLHAVYFKGSEGKKAVVYFRGQADRAAGVYGSQVKYFLERGFRVLLLDERAHGESEGAHIGFGLADRMDGLRWIEWMTEQIGEDAEILLYGSSSGACTVLMASGLELPEQVKGIISDSAFTSAKEELSHVLHSICHVPVFPTLQFADRVNQKKAGYSLKDCSSLKEVKKAQIPVLFIHGEEDRIVPSWMCTDLYANCPSPKWRLVVKGAGHEESCYKAPEAYEAALDEFTESVLGEQ